MQQTWSPNAMHRSRSRRANLTNSVLGTRPEAGQTCESPVDLISYVSKPGSNGSTGQTLHEVPMPIDTVYAGSKRHMG